MTKQLVNSTDSNSHSNNSVNNNVIASNNRNKSRKVWMSGNFTSHLNSTERSGQNDRRKNAFVVGDSMLNHISERGIYKQH